MCIGRRLAEQSMLVLLKQVNESYQLTWIGKNKVDSISKLINKPDAPISLRLQRVK